MTVKAKAARPAGSATAFLNVDLDLSGKSIPPRLVRALSAGALVLHQSKTLAVFEMKTQPKGIDRAVAAFARLVRGLSAADRAAWDGCRARSFNVGIKAGTRPYAKEFAVSQSSLKAALGVGAGFVFTVYAEGGD